MFGIQFNEYLVLQVVSCVMQLKHLTLSTKNSWRLITITKLHCRHNDATFIHIDPNYSAPKCPQTFIYQHQHYLVVDICITSVYSMLCEIQSFWLNNRSCWFLYATLSWRRHVFPKSVFFRGFITRVSFFFSQFFIRSNFVKVSLGAKHVSNDS